MCNFEHRFNVTYLNICKSKNEEMLDLKSGHVIHKSCKKKDKG